MKLESSLSERLVQTHEVAAEEHYANTSWNGSYDASKGMNESADKGRGCDGKHCHDSNFDSIIHFVFLFLFVRVLAASPWH